MTRDYPTVPEPNLDPPDFDDVPEALPDEEYIAHLEDMHWQRLDDLIDDREGARPMSKGLNDNGR